jgi:Tol biopolymer transport system component
MTLPLRRLRTMKAPPRRRSSVALVALLVVVLLQSASAAASAQSVTRIVFSGYAMVDRSVYDAPQLYSVLPTGAGAAQLTRAAVASVDPLPSPDGRMILFTRSDDLWVMNPDGSDQRRLARGKRPVWSPDSREVAYLAGANVREIRVDGGGSRLLVRNSQVVAWSPDGRALAFVRGVPTGSVRVLVRRGGRDRVVAHVVGAEDMSWSADGRWIALACVTGCGEDRLVVMRPTGVRARTFRGASHFAWSPRGDELAFVDAHGLELLDLTTGVVRSLIPDLHYGDLRSMAWSPAGSEIAYTVARSFGVDPFSSVVVVSLDRHGRQLAIPYVQAGSSLAWSPVPSGLNFSPPLPRNTVSHDELRNRIPIDWFDADGDTVALPICNEIDVWSRSEREIERIPESSFDCGPYGTNARVFGFALAGARVVMGTVYGGTAKQASLEVVSRIDRSVTRVGSSDVPGGDNRGPPVRVGEAVGDGDLLAFSSWDRDTPLDSRVLSTSLWRVREASWRGACPDVQEWGIGMSTKPGPCEALASEPGPFVPYDTDSGRIAAAGDNDVVLLGGDGKRLLTVPVRALAAQLAGRDLVVLVRAGLRDYDAQSGTLLHTWSLPDVSSGPTCGYCGTTPRLRLEDAARGLVVYVLDGTAHVLRLSDGADAVVAVAMSARFGESGLFYAYDGAYPWRGRITFIPFDELPLR